MSHEAFVRQMGKVNDLLCTASLLSWDFRTQMAPGGTQARGHQLATVTMLARDTLLSVETRRLLDAADTATQGLAPDSDERRAIEDTRHAIAVHDAIPGHLMQRKAELETTANAVWVEARRTSDFALFQPWLEETVDLSRAIAEAVGYEQTPYDALISFYEPGTTAADLEVLFADLRAGLKPLVDAVRAAPQPRTDFLRRHFPLDGQREAVRRLAVSLGFDTDRGRIDETVHPFEVSFGRGDVRITTRFNPDYIVPSVQGALHETGHALYEQGVDPALSRGVLVTDLVGLYAVAGISFGTHESQSRLWENHVGRSLRFWELNFDALARQFPEALSDVTPEEFWRAFSAVRPGPIRVEADELTYDFHIMLRVEMERALIEGRMKVADLPEAWNATIKDMLGVKVTEDRLGVLQDVHWSTGQIGTFCNYTVGNVMAAQMYDAAMKAPGVAEAVGAGDYAPLRLWLTENLYRHGRRRGRKAALLHATGETDSAAPYLDYLNRKYRSIYRLAPVAA